MTSARLLILIVSLMVPLLLFGDQGLLQLTKLKKKEQRTESTNRALVQGNAERVRQIRLLKDPAALERLIRSELGFAFEDELLIEF